MCLWLTKTCNAQAQHEAKLSSICLPSDYTQETRGSVISNKILLH